MKKAICLVLFSIALISCSTDVTFNNFAAFQGVKDNLAWKASDAKAAITTGNVLTIEALTLTETLTLKMPVPGTFVSQKDVNTHITYALGTSVSKKATYDTTLNDINLLYQTGQLRDI